MQVVGSYYNECGSHRFEQGNDKQSCGNLCRIKSEHVVQTKGRGSRLSRKTIYQKRLHKALGPVARDCQLLYARGNTGGGFEEAKKQLAKMKSLTAKGNCPIILIFPKDCNVEKTPTVKTWL